MGAAAGVFDNWEQWRLQLCNRLCFCIMPWRPTTPYENDKQVRQTHSARGRMKNKWDRGTRFLGRSNCACAMSVECTPCNWRDFQTFSYKLLYFSTWEVLSFFFQRMLMFTVWVYGSWAKEVDSKSPQFSTSFEFSLRGQQICEFQEIPCLSQCASLALWMMAIKSSQGELIEIDWATRACSCRSIPPPLLQDA